MPLSPAAERRHTHTRKVRLEGYEREDGLFDIEGHLTDTKTYSFPNKDRGEIKAGEPIHGMGLRLTIDDTLVVRAVEAYMDHTPFNICPSIVSAFQTLEGMQIGPGWNKKVRHKLGGIQGCTHLVELLSPMATAAFQTLYPVLNKRKEEAKADNAPVSDKAPISDKESRAIDKPSVMDGCHAMNRSGALVKERWPEYYVAEQEKA